MACFDTVSLISATAQLRQMHNVFVCKRSPGSPANHHALNDLTVLRMYSRLKATIRSLPLTWKAAHWTFSDFVTAHADRIVFPNVITYLLTYLLTYQAYLLSMQGSTSPLYACWPIRRMLGQAQQQSWQQLRGPLDTLTWTLAVPFSQQLQSRSVRSATLLVSFC